jgi:Zn-dependent protease
MWPPVSQYQYGRPTASVRRLSTSKTEVFQISVAFIVLTVDLALVSRIYTGFFTGTLPGTNDLETLAIFGALGAFTGFLVHELAHKVVAQRLGYWAEFRYSPIGLLVSLLTAYFGLLFAAPGATVVSGMQDLDSWGRTSLAGPVVNLGEGAAFFALAWAADAAHLPTLAGLFGLLAFINCYFAAFNLIPLGPLDGRKVWHWDRGLWVGFFLIAVLSTLFLFVAPALGWLPFY